MRHVMRLLRRHYGKLAAALLLGLTLYCVWWALPVRPRTSGSMLRGSGPIAFSGDGQFLLTHSGELSVSSLGLGGSQSSQSFEGPLRLWNASNGDLVASLFREGESLRGVELAPDGRTVAVIVGDGPAWVKVFDWYSSRGIGSFSVADSTPCAPLEMHFSPDGQTLAVETFNQKQAAVTLWDVPSGKIRATFEGQNSPFAFSADGRLIATVHEDQDRRLWRFRERLDDFTVITVWDVKTGQKVRQLPKITEDMRLQNVAFDGLEMKVAVIGRFYNNNESTNAGSLSRLMIWDVATGTERNRWEAHEDNYWPERSRMPVNNWYSLQGRSDVISLIQLATRQEWQVPCRALAGKLDRPHVCGRTDHGNPSRGPILCLTLTHWPKPQANAMWKWFEDWLEQLGLASINASNELEFWDLSTGRHLSTIRGGYRDCDCTFSSNGMVMATMNGDERLEIWDIPPRKPLGWFLALASLLLLLTLGGFWWQARRRKRQAALATETIPCGM